MRCLDLGCGGGDVTFEMARIVGPEGSATGVDKDAVKLELARRAASAQDLTQVDFTVSNIHDWAAPSSYDLVYCRNVLQHLSRPTDVLRTMWDAVRPGGVLAVEDADFDGQFCDPPSEAFTFWVEKYQQVLERHGGDPLSGRRLHTRFREAGVPTPSVAVVQRVEREGEAKWLPHSTVEATAEAILEEGLASTVALATALDGLAALAGDSTTIFGSPRLFQAWTRRPTA